MNYRVSTLQIHLKNYGTKLRKRNQSSASINRVTLLAMLTCFGMDSTKSVRDGINEYFDLVNKSKQIKLGLTD